MIGAIVPYVAKIRRSYQSNDIIDRLNYQYTSLIVMIGAITLAATQYVGKPIQMIGYYQWVPIVLAIQAFLFFFPSLIWKMFNFSTGINVKAILTSASQVKKKINIEMREQQVAMAAHHLREALEMQRELKTDAVGFIRQSRKSGIYLCFLYVIVKTLYVLNIFLQFAIFKAFLGTQSTFWGWTILNDIREGREWQDTRNFPRVTMCDFNVRVMGNLHRWTIQCVLMINMFTEKIYIFLWFWFVLVGVLSVLSLVYWTACLMLPGNRREFVSKYLRCTGAVSMIQTTEDERRISDFTKNFLTSDGVFLCRLIQTNGGDLLVGEIITKLYEVYCKKKFNEPVYPDSPNTTSTIPR